MNKTLARRIIKNSAVLHMNGSWLRSLFILILTTAILSGIMIYFPIALPDQSQIIAAGDDPVKLFNLYFPGGISPREAGLMVVLVALGSIILSPLSIGVCRFFLIIARGQKPKFRVIFTPFSELKTVFGSIWLEILILLISIFWGVLFISVPIMLSIAGILLKSQLMLLASVLLTYAALFFFLLWISRYEFAKYIYAEGESGGAFRSLVACIRLLHRRNGECILLRLSYIMWDLLSSFMLPAYFVYFSLRNSVYAKYLYYLRGEILIAPTQRQEQGREE